MTEHQFFIWASFGATAIALALELVLLRVRNQRVLQRLRDERAGGEA